MKVIHVFWSLSFLFTILGVNAQSIHCHLVGEVIGRHESTTLFLTKKGEDIRMSKIEIPIVDNRFDYILNCDYEETYELIFKDEYYEGRWIPVEFIAEDGVVNFRLFPMDRSDQNSIEGVLSKEMSSYKKQVDSLFNFTSLYEEWNSIDTRSDYVKALESLIKNSSDQEVLDSLFNIMHNLMVTDSDKRYSEEGIKLNNRRNELRRKQALWELNYIKRNISIVSYTRLINVLDLNGLMKLDGFNFFREDGFKIFDDIYNVKYPDHPYTKRIKDAYIAYLQIKKGGRFIDFENPSFEGKSIKLSEYIEGKIALIDLWASWCAPCRRNSIQIIPIYEDYKDKGFTVIGVAREEKAEYGINAAKQDGYPWINLLELNDQSQIWEKYGIGNSGGATFLVDRDGTILAIKPTPEEVRKILEDRLD